LGREDLAEKVNWESKVDDSLGYDIVSYEKRNNDFFKIYIEVKTTEGKDNGVFFISKNELETMKKLQSFYWIYRVNNVKVTNPEFYKISYDDLNKNYNLNILNYIVEQK